MTAVKFVAASFGVIVLLAVLSWVVSPSEPEIGFGGVARPVPTSAGTEPEPTEAERWSRTVRIAPGMPLRDFSPKAPTAVMDSARYRRTRTGPSRPSAGPTTNGSGSSRRRSAARTPATSSVGEKGLTM